MKPEDEIIQLLTQAIRLSLSHFHNMLDLWDPGAEKTIRMREFLDAYGRSVSDLSEKGEITESDLTEVAKLREALEHIEMLMSVDSAEDHELLQNAVRAMIELPDGPNKQELQTMFRNYSEGLPWKKAEE